MIIDDMFSKNEVDKMINKDYKITRGVTGFSNILWQHRYRF